MMSPQERVAAKAVCQSLNYMDSQDWSEHQWQKFWLDLEKEIEDNSYSFICGCTIYTEGVVALNFDDIDHKYVGELPEELCLLNNIKKIRIINQPKLSFDLGRIGEMLELKTIIVRGDGPINSLMLPLEKCPGPERLDFAQCGTLNGLPENIVFLKNLRELVFANCPLNCQLESSIGDCENLEEMIISESGLYGRIPREIGFLKNLRHLDLTNNNLNGCIPGEIADCIDLETLAVYGNKLEGELPGGLFLLENLKYLHLEYNQLSGQLPDEISKSRSLRELFINHNCFSGHFPPLLGIEDQAANIMAQNNLIEELPDDILRFPFADFSNNPLTRVSQRVRSFPPFQKFWPKE